MLSGRDDKWKMWRRLQKQLKTRRLGFPWPERALLPCSQDCRCHFLLGVLGTQQWWRANSSAQLCLNAKVNLKHPFCKDLSGPTIEDYVYHSGENMRSTIPTYSAIVNSELQSPSNSMQSVAALLYRSEQHVHWIHTLAKLFALFYYQFSREIDKLKTTLIEYKLTKCLQPHKTRRDWLYLP